MAGKQGKSSRKIGRNKDWCKAYANRNQREKNKIKKLNKHLERQPEDPLALKAKDRWRKKIIGF